MGFKPMKTLKVFHNIKPAYFIYPAEDVTHPTASLEHSPSTLSFQHRLIDLWAAVNRPLGLIPR
jgi:hypothetical protein